MAQQKMDKLPESGKKTGTAPGPDYATVRKLTCGQTTSQDVRVLIGKPVSIASNSKSTEWAYRFDSLTIQVQFNAEDKLTGCSYVSSRTSRPDLDVPKIKSIQVGTAEADLIRLLGEPTHLSLSASRMEMAYANTTEQTRFQVLLVRKSDFNVTDYQFSVTAKRPLLIDSDQLISIKNGQTSLADIVHLFGEPTQKTISHKAESWCYESTDSKLLLQFNRDQPGTVVAYQYNLKQN